MVVWQTSDNIVGSNKQHRRSLDPLETAGNRSWQRGVVLRFVGSTEEVQNRRYSLEVFIVGGKGSVSRNDLGSIRHCVVDVAADGE